MRGTIRRQLVLGFLLLVMVVVFRGYFYPGIITADDWMYQPRTFLTSLDSPPYAWELGINPGPIGPFELSNYPIRFGLGLLAEAGFGFAIGERVLFQFPVVILSAVSMYYLVTRLFDDKFAALFATLLYSLNTYVLLLGTHLTIRIAYLLTPLFLALYDKTLETKEIRHIALISLVGLLMFVYDPRIPYIVAFILLLYTVGPGRRYLSLTKGIAKKYALGVILVFGLSAYTWVSMLLTPSVSPATRIAAEPWITFMTLSDALALRHPFYSLTEPIASFETQSLNPAFFVIPIVVAVSLLAPSKSENERQTKTFFAVVALIGAFLVKQENPPIGWTYTWLFQNFPGFNMFREASKFYLLVTLGYAPLFGIGVRYLYERLRQLRLLPVDSEHDPVSVGVAALFVFSLLLVSVPMYQTDELAEDYTPIEEIPESYQEISRFIESRSGDGRVLWVPSTSRFSYYSQSHPALTPEYSAAITRATVQDPEDEMPNTRHLGELLSKFGVQYIVVNPDLNDEYDLHYHLDSGRFSVPQRMHVSYLDTQKDLRRVTSGEKYAVYENEAYGSDKDSYLVEAHSRPNLVDASASEYTVSSKLRREASVWTADREQGHQLNQIETVVLTDGTASPLLGTSNRGIDLYPHPENHKPNQGWTWDRYGVGETDPAERSHAFYGDGGAIAEESRVVRDDMLSARADPNRSHLLREWTFNGSVSGWSCPSSEMTCDEHDGRLRAQLTNSSWGWKTIVSPSINVSNTGMYRFSLVAAGEDSHAVHVKITELNEEGEQLQTESLDSVGDGDFDSAQTTIDYVPKNESTEHLRFEIWQGHETPRPLPNQVYVDNVRVYNVTEFTEFVSTEMQFRVDKEGDYKLFGRYLADQEGGKIRVTLDGESVVVDTESSLEGFRWEELATHHLEEGEHTVVLENVRGRNAVNLLTLLSENEYTRQKRKLTEDLETKTVLHQLEAESALHLRDGFVRTNEDASNRELVTFNGSGSANRTIETVRSGRYRLAVRASGNLTVRVDDRRWNVSRETPGLTYVGNVTLNRGYHDVDVRTGENDTAMLDTVWLYSTPSVADAETSTIPEVFASESSPASVQRVERVNPTKYEVHVNSSEPYLLSFAEKYDRLWTAEVHTPNGTQQYEPVSLHSLTNGFYVYDTGEHTVTLRYQPQRWFYLGTAISILTLIACLGLLCYSYWNSAKFIALITGLRCKRQDNNRPSDEYD